MSWLQSEKLLRPHTGAEKQPDALSNSVVGQQLHEGSDFLCGEALLALYRAGLSHFLCEAHQVLANQIVGLSFVEDLIEHSSALRKAGVGPSVASKLFREHLDTTEVSFQIGKYLFACQELKHTWQAGHQGASMQFLQLFRHPRKLTENLVWETSPNPFNTDFICGCALPYFT